MCEQTQHSDDVSRRYYEDPRTVEYYSGTKVPDPSGIVGQYTSVALDAGMKVLDLACGQGRVAFALAQRGVAVHGIDYSAMMIEACAARLRLLPVKTRQLLSFSVGRMEEFVPSYGPMIVLIPDKSIQHLIADSDVKMLFDAVRVQIGECGLFAFDVFAPEQQLFDLENGAPRTLAMEDSFGRKWRRTYCSNRRISDDTFEIRVSTVVTSPDREQEDCYEQCFVQRVFHESWLRAMLNAAGLSRIEKHEFVAPSASGGRGGVMYLVRAEC